jgi:uroporphyrinogen-III synthase
MADLPPGFGVLVTRPSGQAGELRRLIEASGGEAVMAPLLEITPVAGDSPGACRLARLDNFDWLVFVSPNAVRCAFALRGTEWQAGAVVKIAAIGQATARALAETGVAVDLKPKQQSNSEALLVEPEWFGVAGQRFLIVRGEGGREFLADSLRTRGAHVEYAEVYRRVPSSIDLPGLLARWRAGRIGVTTVTSGEALERLAQLMDGANQDLLLRTPMVVIGERLRILAQALGCTDVIAVEPGDAEIFDAVLRIAQALIKTHQLRG